VIHVDEQERTGCRCCGSALTGPRLNLGNLPPCNRFSKRPTDIETRPLVVTQCDSCGLVQLALDPPLDFLVPRVPWISYREPDAHLDDLSAKLARLLPQAAHVMGVGPFDSPLLERLGRCGFEWKLVDLMENEPCARPGRYPYLETLQSRLSTLDSEAARFPPADLIVCRYLLEHCHDPVAALLALKRLLAPQGKLLIEVPDCRQFLSRVDYSFIWEEHTCYFCASTLPRLARRAGLRVLDFVRYEGALEDALVFVLENEKFTDDSNDAARAPSALFAAYVEKFAGVRESWRHLLETLGAERHKIALFGVGHQAVMFVNALGLQQYISAAADDQVEKQGYFAPGIAAPITSSAALADDAEVGAWLLAISPRSQVAVRNKFASLLNRGLRMYSIFPEG
jgi:SAM-dependent methyltransferase